MVFPLKIYLVLKHFDLVSTHIWQTFYFSLENKVHYEITSGKLPNKIKDLLNEVQTGNY